MDRAQKEKVVDELGQIFESSGVVVVAHYTGMTVAQMQDLRAKLRDVGGSVRVAKNTLAKIALEGKPSAKMADLLTGMTVLAYSEDPVAAAKVCEAYAKGNDKFQILGGAMGKLALVVAYLRGLVTGDTGGGVPRSASRVGPPGVDAGPIPRDVAYLSDNGSPTGWNSLGVVQQEGDAGPGEVILSARTLTGQKISWIRLLADGTVSVANTMGQIIMGPEGSISLNRVEIDVMGNITLPSGADVTAGIVSLTTHVHSVSAAPGTTGAPAPPGPPP